MSAPATPLASPLASVVICTRNRARSLERTLASLVVAAAQTAEPWELIVVDNGSTDDTATAAAAFADRLPLRVVSQPIAGLSNARNAGVAASRGDYVLWTDDDVVVDERWLAAWFHAFRTRPDDAVFGGRTEPRFEEPRVEWFIAGQEHLQSLLAVRDADWTEVTGEQMPFGLNYAVRGTEQRRHLYDPELGVAPGRRRGGEEVAVINAVLAEGATGSWVWDATVFHMIPPERQTAEYIIHYYDGHGMEYPLFHARSGAINCLKGLLRITPKLSVNFLTIAATVGQKPNIPALVNYGLARGTARQYLASAQR
jgi:glycosyltransferase involved in cell wall biosynthesis